MSSKFEYIAQMSRDTFFLGKQTIIGKVKEYINNKIAEDFGDDADTVMYYTINIDEFFTYLESLQEDPE